MCRGGRCRNGSGCGRRWVSGGHAGARTAPVVAWPTRAVRGPTRPGSGDGVGAGGLQSVSGCTSTARPCPCGTGAWSHHRTLPWGARWPQRHRPIRRARAPAGVGDRGQGASPAASTDTWPDTHQINIQEKDDQAENPSPSRLGGRASPRLQHADRQAPHRGRVLLRPVQGLSRHRHPPRQDRHLLPRDERSGHPAHLVLRTAHGACPVDLVVGVGRGSWFLDGELVCPGGRVPERFGPWQTLGERRSRWSADGTWGHLVDQVRARADLARERGRGGCRWAPAASTDTWPDTHQINIQEKDDQAENPSPSRLGGRASPRLQHADRQAPHRGRVLLRPVQGLSRHRHPPRQDRHFLPRDERSGHPGHLVLRTAIGSSG
ncbi:putative transposase of IS4/5 family (DUF4096) [Streptoalloteichus tenebrarius]|uniref:Transposase of IS4/5 family (DUF4096) n=1 Tax=Streptoalloteichus tenebrarius (strain ATCC 17920 / DSM 40477 / JCM 4838 / CBS 697.72 / NBRC 16177 / NCIMB 11028 / NRRL B-12390 / A12253. 1 / ISP 5477) TaxID=1933 RepID=A0ABT1HWZ7_STRSD|nr:putative transposase of IS4/5 family (DUF4096) [Streptoalloteichus tenebrarius]